MTDKQITFADLPVGARFHYWSCDWVKTSRTHASAIRNGAMFDPDDVVTPLPDDEEHSQ